MEYFFGYDLWNIIIQMLINNLIEFNSSEIFK